MTISIWQTVGSVMLLVAVGYVLYRVKWIQSDHLKLLTRLITYIGAPCLALENLYAYLTPELLHNSLLAIVVSACGMSFGAFAGWLGGRLFRVPIARMGLVIVMSALSNSLFVGLPMATGILGEAAIPYVMYYFITVRVLMWSVGLYFVRRDAAGGNVRFLSKDTIKAFLNAPIIVFAVCLLLLAARVQLPGVILKTAGYLGNIVTPLSLILIGAIMGRCGIIKSLKFERGMETVLLSRFLLVPLATILLARVCGFETIGVQAFTLVAAMPVMSQAVVQCEQYGADADFAAKNIVVTTFISAITIPITSMLIM